MNVRRVVTGHTPEGKAVVASDAAVEPFTFGDGGAYHVLWGADAPARFPLGGQPKPAIDGRLKTGQRG